MFSFLKKFLLSSKSISISELAEILKRDKIKLLDVRTTSEYQGGHIRGAQHFPLERIGSYQGKKDEKVYVICHSGLRSRRAAAILRKKGYDVVNVRGGMMAWLNQKVGGII